MLSISERNSPSDYRYNHYLSHTATVAFFLFSLSRTEHDIVRNFIAFSESESNGQRGRRKIFILILTLQNRRLSSKKENERCFKF
jgi:hypothetical protein